MASFLGIVVVWFEEGVIYRAVLEFIRSVLKILLVRGMASRGRCFPHIINLLAKVFLINTLVISY